MSWNVKVPRETLLTKVILNRDNHRAIVEKALDRYRAAVVEHLDKMIATAKKGKDVDTFVRLPRPEDHTNDYNTVIGMLELSQEEFVSLGTDEYASFVEDRWTWTDRFATTNASYGIR